MSLSEEQRLMRQSCRAFVDDVVIPFMRQNWQREWSMTPEDRLPREILAGAQLGQDPLEERRRARAHTLRSFIDQVYEPWAEANLRTGAETIARLRTAFTRELDRKLGDLTPWIIESWRLGRIKSGVTASTINRDFAPLRAAIARAVDWKLLDKNPIAGVKGSKIDRGPLKLPFNCCRLGTLELNVVPCRVRAPS